MKTIIETGLVPFDKGIKVSYGTVVRGLNICLWYDGTLRPWFKHKANCKWSFDGQIWRHI